jgi:hypothetical protein
VPVLSTASDPAVVRVRVDGEAEWPSRLPTVPDGHFVTVSTTSLADTTRSAELRERGYVLVGVGQAPLAAADESVVDLVVPRGLVDNSPDWWELLTAVADRVFPLAFGPVARLFRAHITAHDAAHGLTRIR